MAAESRPAHLMILDANGLRQAAFSCFLKEWAGSHGLDVFDMSPEVLTPTFGGLKTSRLIIISVGSDSIRIEALYSQLQVLHGLAENIPVVVISDREEPAEIIAAYRVGCRGFLPTSIQPKLATRVLDFILDGGTFFPPSGFDADDAPLDPGTVTESTVSIHAHRRVPDQYRSSANDTSDDITKAAGFSVQPPLAFVTDVNDDEIQMGEPHVLTASGLTHRQHQVLVHLHKGQPNKLIARALGVTEGTVKVHVRQIMRRLGATNRTQAAVLCGAKIQRDAHSNGDSAVNREDEPFDSDIDRSRSRRVIR